jgi:MerR family transcriptional regulator, copper efflux regulator
MTMFGLTTGELARRANVNVETIRYYERRGLLPVPERRLSGYRQYTEGDVSRVNAIRRARQLGFTLKEILELLPSLSVPRPACAALKRHAQRKIRDLSRRILELEAKKASLEFLVNGCTRRPGSKRPCNATISLADPNA